MLDPTTSFVIFLFFFFNDTAPTEIYTLSYTTLFRSHPGGGIMGANGRLASQVILKNWKFFRMTDRKSTRLNSSHRCISYAVFCLKKKKKKKHTKINTLQTPQV